MCFRRFRGLSHLSCLSIRLVNESRRYLTTIDHMARQSPTSYLDCLHSQLSEPLRLVAMKRIIIFAERQVTDTRIGPSRLDCDRRNYRGNGIQCPFKAEKRNRTPNAPERVPSV